MLPLTSRILIVDDDPDSCELIEIMLRYADAGVEVACAQTPEDGLRLAAAHRFDLFVLDQRLPGMNGSELCRAIRRMHADTPIMFFTGSAYERDRLEAFRAGANDFLVKRDDLNKVTVTVKRLLGGGEPAAAVRGVPAADYLSGASMKTTTASGRARKLV